MDAIRTGICACPQAPFFYFCGPHPVPNAPVSEDLREVEKGSVGGPTDGMFGCAGASADATDIDDGVEILERFELDLHFAITLSQLLEQHLPQVFCDRSRFAAGGDAFNRNADALIIIQECALNAG